MSRGANRGLGRGNRRRHRQCRPRAVALPSKERLDVTIEAIGAGGDGIARSTLGRLYVPLTVPGDRVRVRVVERRGDGWAAALEEVLDPGPDRATPPCPHFGRCGGCALQHLADDAYADWKQGLVTTALARVGITAAPVSPLVRIPPGARRRCTLAMRVAAESACVGFVVRRGEEIVDLSVCPILEPQIVALVPALRHLMMTVLPRGARGDITVTRLDLGLDVVLSVLGARQSALSLEQRERLAAFAATTGLVRLSWQPYPDVPPEPLIELHPTTVRFGSVAVKVAPGGFLQATAAGTAALVAAALEALDGVSFVADLFAGAGTFALPLAETGASIHAVDADRDAITALRAAADRNELNRLTTAVRDLTLNPLSAEELQEYNGVLFDPPRAGAQAQACELARSPVGTVVAVSCNPATFARDARILAEGGYTLVAVTPVDQFLWSQHLELVAVFQR